MSEEERQLIEQLEKDYVESNITLKDLAEKYGLKLYKVEEMSAAGRWSKKRKLARAAARQEQDPIGEEVNILENMEAEYIAGSITTEQIARKYGYSYSRIRDYAVENQWVKKRKEYREEVKNKILEEKSRRIVESEAEINTKHYSMVDSLLSIVSTQLSDPKKHLMYKDGTYKTGSLEKVMNILKLAQESQRLSADIASITDKMKYEIELKKLEATHQRLKLETLKVTGHSEDESQKKAVDSFTQALKGAGEEVWEEEEVEH